MIVNYIYDQKGLWQHHASSGSIVEIDNKVGLEKAGGTVRKDNQSPTRRRVKPLFITEDSCYFDSLCFKGNGTIKGKFIR